MTIALTKDIRVAGDTLASGTSQTLDASLEADLVARGSAIYTTDPMLGSGTIRVPIVVMSVGTPFMIPPGDGASNGLQFTGSAGAFSLSAAIMANAWNFFRGGFWMYLTASFGGSSRPAGWYWAVMSSDTAGVIYANTYTSGNTKGPSSPTAFDVNLTGWLTTTTAEIVGPTGFVIPVGALGKSGALMTIWKLLGNLTGTKSFFHSIGGSTVAQINALTLPHVEFATTVRNAGIEFEQNNSSSPRTAPLGIGGPGYGTVISAAFESTSIDFKQPQPMYASLKLSVNTACAVLIGCSTIALPGD